MKVSLRKARTSDLGPLASLARKTYEDAFGESFEPPDLAAHVETKLSDACFAQYLSEDTFLLAEHETRLVGFLQFGAAGPDPLFEQMSPGDVEFRRIYVLADHQNRGIGRRLLDTALAETLVKRARNVFLDVWEENTNARRLYEGYGFRAIGKRRFRVRSGAETGFDLITVRRQVARVAE